MFTRKELIDKLLKIESEIYETKFWSAVEKMMFKSEIDDLYNEKRNIIKMLGR